MQLRNKMPSFASRNEMCCRVVVACGSVPALGKVLSLLSCLSHKTSSSQGISVVPWFGLDKERESNFFFLSLFFHEKRGKLYGTHKYIVLLLCMMGFC